MTKEITTLILICYKLALTRKCSKFKVLVPGGLVEAAPESILREHHLTRHLRRLIYLRRRKRWQMPLEKNLKKELTSRLLLPRNSGRISFIVDSSLIMSLDYHKNIRKDIVISKLKDSVRISVASSYFLHF